jgi:hypothetical protein
MKMSRRVLRSRITWTRQKSLDDPSFDISSLSPTSHLSVPFLTRTRRWSKLSNCMTRYVLASLPSPLSLIPYKLSKPAVLDSDSDSDGPTSKDVTALSKRMAAQKLEADRTGEVQRLQERQKRESAKQQQKRAAQRPARQSSGGGHPDLQDLDFGTISGKTKGLPAPLQPDSDRESYASG